MDLLEVENTIKTILTRKTNDMTKIKLKCWEYHSKSRIKNGNDPFSFSDYSYRLGKSTYLDYIKYDLIDCEDIGGKEVCIQVVEKWYS